MFGQGFGPRPSIVDLLALSQLAPGGGSAPLLQASAAGGQTVPLNVMAGESAPVARPPVGMFAAGPRVGASTSLRAGGTPFVGNNDQPISQAPRFGGGPMGNPPGALSLNGGGMDGGMIPDGPINMMGGINDALARNALNPSPDKPHKGMFPGKDWKTIAGILSDAVAGAFGGRPMFGPMMAQRAQQEFENKQALELYRQKAAIDREEKMHPYIERIGDSVGFLDPSAQTFQPFYSAPEPFEAYAAARGFVPGTPEYQQAVQDYRLGSYSDPAMEARTELENLRYQNRDALQDARLETSRRNTDARVAATRRGQNMTDSRVRRGQDVTDKRVRDSAGFKGTGGKGKGDLIGPVYVRGKVRVQFSKSQNKYVPVP